MAATGAPLTGGARCGDGRTGGRVAGDPTTHPIKPQAGQLERLHTRLGLNVADQDYFRATRDSLRPQVSEPVRMSGGPKRTVIVFTAPVFSAEGQLAGVLGGSLELYSPEFFGELKNIAIGQGGFLTIHSVRSQLAILHADAGDSMPVATVDPLLQRALGGAAGQDAVGDSHGVPALQVYQRLRNVPWLLGVVLPLHEVMQPARVLGRHYLLLLLVAMVSLSKPIPTLIKP